MRELCLAPMDQVVQQHHVELGRLWFLQATRTLGDEAGEYRLTRARESSSLALISRISESLPLLSRHRSDAGHCVLDELHGFMARKVALTRGRAWPQRADLEETRCQQWLGTNVDQLARSAGAG